MEGWWDPWQLRLETLHCSIISVSLQQRGQTLGGSQEEENMSVLRSLTLYSMFFLAAS